MTQRNTGPHSAWVQPDEKAGRNAYCVFALQLPPLRPGSPGAFHVFADARYRLWINGRICGYGPARFHPDHPEYDSYHLGDFVAPESAATILVEVWNPGCNTFQTQPSRLRFWANGEVETVEGGTISLATPGGWQCRMLHSREPLAIPMSFAIGPVEILDADGWANEIRLVDRRPLECDGPPPTPRSIPALEVFVARPSRCLYAGGVDDGDEELFAAFRHFPSHRAAHLPGIKPLGAMYATRIFSPTAQDVEAGLFWGSHFLNGEALSAIDDPSRGNRQVALCRLRAGWNTLFGSIRAPLDVWGFVLGLPSGLGLKLSASGQPDDGHTFLISDLISERDFAGLDLSRLAAEAVIPEEFHPVNVPSGRSVLPPAREMAWLRAAEPRPPFAWNGTVRGECDACGRWMAVLDFGGEFLGHPALEVECGEPVEVQIGTDEYIREDGTLALYQASFLANTADRYLLPAGRHRIEGFHNRGGRYAEIVVRSSPGARVEISDVSVRQFKTPAHEEATFVCDDAFWNWAWDISRKTLQASLEDVWSDSPWREQGCYLGDSLVQFHAHACLSADPRIPRRIIRLFAQCQNPDGQIPAVAPAWMTRPHPDFTLLFPVFVRDYLSVFPDPLLAAELQPTLDRIWSSPLWNENAEGLISADCGFCFFDWGVEPEAREGLSSALNAVRIMAADALAEIAALAGDDSRSRAFGREAQRLRECFRSAYWDRDLGRFLCTIRKGGERIPARALHANAMAWAFDIASPEQAGALLPWLLGELSDNAAKILARASAKDSGQLELFFLFFFLTRLAGKGFVTEAERIYEENWGVMREAGAWTLWESIGQSARQQGSLCHSWSVAPLLHASRHILGISRPCSGRPDMLRIQPDTASAGAAEGSFPTQRGLVHVSWSRARKEIFVRHPEAVVCEIIVPPDWMASTETLPDTGSAARPLSLFPST